ncbi:hypothetical protein [Lactococcus lactis]|nr:hypothetical protein [Lactococcus lactis]
MNKPVVDLSGWQRPEDIDYNTLSQHVRYLLPKVQENSMRLAKI